MVHIDRQADAREANAALLQLLGCEARDVEGAPFLSLFAAEDAALVAPMLEDVLHRGADGRVEVRLRHRDGTVRWVDLSVSANGMGRAGARGSCAILQDVTERVELQAQLEDARARLVELALHDPLTGLPNRTQLADELTAAQQRASVSGTHVAVLFIDLDGFKRVNDTAGHETGDRLLVEAGQRLRHLLRPEDVAARFGGDEFVLCCSALATDPTLADEQAQRIAERVRASLSVPFGIDGQTWVLGASVGIALSRAGDDDPDALLRIADADMYRVKASR
jgi:diguanylate cyclase (GGDEF)-like protein/PAS domain S-box-containing protein